MVTCHGLGPFGTIGDGFMSGNPKKWLLPGLLAFFAGHLAYLALFMKAPHAPIDSVTLSMACAVFILSGGLVLCLWKSLGDMRWPVVAYTIVIAFMGAAAVTLDIGTPLVAVGAAMFIISDVLVALEVFKVEEDAPHPIYYESTFMGALFRGTGSDRIRIFIKLSINIGHFMGPARE